MIPPARRSLFWGLGILGLTLGGSVGIALYLESHTELQRSGTAEEPRRSGENDWQESFYTALRLFRGNRLAEAETELLKLIGFRPGTPEAWQLLGVVHYRQDRMRDAEQAFRHLIRLQPHNEAGYNNLSQALLRLNRIGEAQEMIQQALEMAPGNATILLNGAALAARTGQTGEALQRLRGALAAGVRPEVIARNPDLVQLLNQPEFSRMYEEECKTPWPLPGNAIQPDARPLESFDDSGLLNIEKPDEEYSEQE